MLLLAMPPKQTVRCEKPGRQLVNDEDPFARLFKAWGDSSLRLASADV